MNDFFLIYRSSAGSGKTYTLVREYLLLALKHPDRNYRYILAITFTNKAMQEMKNRIIDSLHEFSTGKPHPMKDELMKGLGIDEPEFLRRSNILLEKILHEYSYFSISTIDAFFQRIIRSFTKELGLYGQYQLETDQELVKIQAIDNLLADLKEDDDLTNWVVRFAEEQLDEGKNWDIRRSLNEFSNEIFREHFADLEENLPDTKRIKEFQDQLIQEVSIFKKKLNTLCQKIPDILDEHQIDVDELKYKQSGAAAFAFNVLKGKIQLPGNRSKAGCLEESEWVSPKAPRVDYIVQIVRSHLMPAMSEAISYYSENSTRYYSASAALKFIYGFGLLSDLAAKIKDYKHDRDLLFIQDASRLIRALLKDSDTPFIFEKVGTFFNHYLIDEFQDTSSMQWQCLHPLVLETISQGNKSMVVGDTKQSIYRWRGGDWSLLEHKIMEDILPHPHKLELLDSNYRSMGHIITFNNLLFQKLPKMLLENTPIATEELLPETTTLIEKICGVYEQSSQRTPQGKEEQGLIELSFIENDEAEHWTESALTLLTERIQNLLGRGFQFKDIALLVRKKDEAAQLAQHLLGYVDDQGAPKFPVLTNEALLIKNSRVVMLIINALRYLQSHDDEIALAELAYHYHCIINSVEVLKFHELLQGKHKVNENILPFDFHKEKDYLQHLSIEEAVEHLIRLFSLPGNSGEAAYLQTFQDKVLEFGRAESNDIASFLLWWEEKGEKESINIPSGLDAISIMTIHKAKGLQFPVVIIPFANWEIDSNNKTLLWSSSPDVPFNGMEIPLKYSSELQHTYFKDAYYKEKFQAALDSINMLYVAFTRAEQELYAFAPTQSRGSTIGTYLLNSISDESFDLYEYFSPQSITFRMGTDTMPRKGNVTSPEQVMIENYESHNWRERLVVRKINKRAEASMEEALRGTQMHSLLSKIQYKNDLIEKFFFTSLQDEDLKNELKDVINHPEIAAYFSPPFTVLNEKSILVGNDIFRPDRIVVDGDKAVVIDYKWGSRHDKYSLQVKNYMQLLKQMGYNYTKGIIYYVDQKSVEKVS